MGYPQPGGHVLAERLTVRHGEAMTTRHTAYLLLITGDDTVAGEARRLAAAASREVVELAASATSADVARHLTRAAAALIDAEAATRHADAIAGAQCPAYLLGVDSAPLDLTVALDCRAREAFVLPQDAETLLVRLGELPDTPPSPGSRAAPPPVRADVVALCGSAGGAGTSVLAAAVARRAAHRAPGRPITLIDADARSGGVDLLLGCEDAAGPRWPDLAGSAVIPGAATIRAEDLWRALPQDASGVALLTSSRGFLADPWQLDAAAVTTITRTLAQGDGLVVVDGGEPAWAEADVTIVVVPAEVRAASAAAAMCAQLRADKLDHGLIVRHRGWSGLTAKEVADVAHAEVLAELPTIPGLAKSCEVSGLPKVLPRALRQAADAVYAAVAGSGGRQGWRS
ncbi:septum site-determining protein Ssd [Corynebacterium uterequi]|uniref:Helicase/secretion neighborhood CpaE-like protein n=1 Tax=Corynebacterium uterequi TaxID=1072256 RepID=A0A0G3HE41_9CORY|nr:septum site-determining protein Ssd [Corynebacterium uterequi]AKK10198.1 helicase/secretion neighborhood CpaE-like protein [Corynebacterium uterequi]